MTDIEKQNGVYFFSCPGAKIDQVVEVLSGLEGFLGNEELASEGSNLFQPEGEFEVLEFGSEAAIKCAEWLESGEFQKSRSEEAFVKAYFEGSFPRTTFFKEALDLSEEAQAQLQRLAVRELSWSLLPNHDYLENYKKSVKGHSFGQNLWVGPPWDKIPEGKTIFIVEPGMAFGTGDHPTTQMCLELLESLSNSTHNPGGNSSEVKNPIQSVDISQIKTSNLPLYDIGTGTGVLALAAKKFFPQRAQILTDLDPLCRIEVEKVFAANGEDLKSSVLRFGPSADLSKVEIGSKDWPKSDFLISNIYAEVLTGLMPKIAELSLPGGLWIVSGLLESAASKEFDEQASQYFELLESKSSIVEEAQLDATKGLNARRHVWLARLFKRL